MSALLLALMLVQPATILHAQPAVSDTPTQAVPPAVTKPHDQPQATSIAASLPITATQPATPSSTPTPYLDSNIVQNPGFESGTLAPWVISDTNPGSLVSTAQAHSGTYAALLGSAARPAGRRPVSALVGAQVAGGAKGNAKVCEGARSQTRSWAKPERRRVRSTSEGEAQIAARSEAEGEPSARWGFRLI